MTYALQIKASASRELAKLPKLDRKRADAKIVALQDNPRPQGSIKMSGYDDLSASESGNGE